MLDAAEIIALAKGKHAIGIDGLPVSGKSTLAETLEHELGAVCLYLDDFVMPPEHWPLPLRPAYPFPYIRHARFLDAARALLTKRVCTYQPYDWASNRLAEPRTLVAGSRPVVIEGVSALDPTLAGLYDLRLWIESDRARALEAALARGAGQWADAWQNYFLSSIDLYLATAPRERADVTVAGRGARPGRQSGRRPSGGLPR